MSETEIDPRHRLGGERYERNEMRDKYGYVESSMIDMFEKLKVLPEEVTDAEREKLQKVHERIMNAQRRQLRSTLDLEMRFKNPYPFETRGQEMWFNTNINAAKTARDEEWAKGEARQVLDRLAIDLTWGENQQKILEGMGGVLDKFYDWHNMLYWVRERYRSDPTASFYEGAFQKELPGITTSTKEEKVSLEKWGEGERERAIKYQDECMYWRMAIAEVNQMSGGTSSFMKNKEGEPTLNEAEAQFIRLVFEDRGQREIAEKKEKGLLTKEDSPYKQEDLDKHIKDGWLVHKQDGLVPRSLLNWYSMGSIEEKKRYYLAAIETLLVTSDEEGRSIKELLKDPSISSSPEKIREIAKHIIGEAEKKVENWWSMDRSSNEERAREIVRAGIIHDWGHFASTRMGWGWKYVLKETGEEGQKKLEVVRTRSGGGTTVATDSISPAYWRDYIAGNEGKPRTIGMFPPMSDEFRKRLLKERPDWKPVYLEETAQRDKKLQTALSRMWSETSWDKTTKEELQKQLWYWETPYKEKDGTPILIPVFFPPEISSLNFLNTISLTGDRDIEEGDPSVWDELCAGKNLSDFEWSKMGDQALYRWMITIGQVVRYTTTMLDNKTQANEGQFKDFFGDEGNLRELLKRADLGTRDEKDSKAILTMALVPLLISLSEAAEHGMIGHAGDKIKDRTEWLEQMARWSTELSGMPKEYGNLKKYSQGMVHLLRFYTKIIGRLAFVAGDKDSRALQLSFNSMRKELSEMGVSTHAEVLKSPTNKETRR